MREFACTANPAWNSPLRRPGPHGPHLVFLMPIIASCLGFQRPLINFLRDRYRLLSGYALEQVSRSRGYRHQGHGRWVSVVCGSWFSCFEYVFHTLALF